MDAPAQPLPDIDPRTAAWLEIATDGLADEARQRVSREIVDHVTESAAERRAAGAGADEALAAAVDALGDPVRARRALRRANLRRSEAKIVGSLAKPVPRWILALHLVAIPLFVLFTLPHVDTTRDQIVFLLSNLGIVAGIAARFSLARWLARKGRLRAALIADVFGPWLFYASLVIGSRLVVEAETTADIVIYAAAFGLALLFIARLWPKIGRQRPHLS